MYKITACGKVKRDDGKIITNDSGSADWKDYQHWLEEGNVPEHIGVVDRNELIKKTVKQINDKTDQLILAGIVFKGQQVPLPKEDQMNITNLIIAQDMIEFPIQIKTNGLSINNKLELLQLYASGLKHVQTQLQSGWYLKNLLQNMTNEELMSFVDKR